MTSRSERRLSQAKRRLPERLRKRSERSLLTGKPQIPERRTTIKGGDVWLSFKERRVWGAVPEFVGESEGSVIIFISGGGGRRPS